MKTKYLFIFTVVLFLGCDSSKLKETPMVQFSGKWKNMTSGIFHNVEFTIIEKDGQFKGYLTKLNDNKFVSLFSSLDDTFISSIQRKSNFKFEITQKRIASQLFSEYGESTSDKYEVEFQGLDTIKVSDQGYFIRLK